MIRALADMLAGALIALTSLTGNIGWAVVILTALIRLALHPLTRWGLKTLRRMQAAAPQVEALRGKYSQDPRRAREEIASLYRRNGINAWTPTLPTVLQIPLLLALFQVLTRRDLFAGQTFLGIPLDAAPCSGSLTLDLSCFLQLIRNPFLALLPVAVVATTYVLQRLSVADTKQSRHFPFITLLAGVLSLYAPAVISLYWIASTAIQILEHNALLRSPGFFPPEPSASPANQRGKSTAVSVRPRVR